MNIGDLVRVKYDGTTGLIVKVEVTRRESSVLPSDPCIWIHLHSGESFKPEYLEVISASG